MTDTSPPRRSASLPIALVLAVAVAAALGLSLGQKLTAPTAPAQPAVQGTRLYPAPRPVPDFSLDGPAGSTLAAADLRGRWTLVFIGFTHCPDICPTTLGLLASAAKQWQDLPEPQRPRILFVSVDPERDDADKVAEYARFFDPAILAATADHARLETFTRNLGMVYMKTPLEGGDYTVDHSASVAVLTPDGALAGLMGPPLQPALIAADMRALIGAAR